ncbi:MAG: polysaccharide deacetylase family protein [Rhodospirillaceae bacterium]|jgi:hypothetical protein|nr:polysaccharide deacetylase family protein [Rhodospirillaceae bacterium]MBT4771806.1 polysaccharide deacetylase family protein [Rhodospirillaceae bacterium]MBT5358677.1 polysaccharide deacetylase family protein [Rhodospirillaceae bacterium]MBT5768702.1 polysaccharide deacetylase family protein [Rhodospirillaceae bacterium]MBT6309487.1 polysaccharide deacetylase family protein [Rhodospirillaceae bacterium]
MIDKLAKAARDPGLAWAWAYSRWRPQRAVTRSVALARRAGLRQPHFILSFDCDTDADSAVVGAMHARLRSGGLSPLYAVAGEVLAASADDYRAIAQDGAVFLNHGFRRHAEIDPASGDVASTYFYGAVSRADWQDDIRRGDEAIGDILDQRPNGFRTPHFASFESPRDLVALWQFLSELGYRYSSSTRPLFGLRYGPFFTRAGIIEFPVSGCLSEPGQILDSWGLIRGGDGTSRRLLDELRAYLASMEADQPGLLNIYLDPADVAADEDVLAMLTRFAPYSAGDFASLLGEARHG